MLRQRVDERALGGLERGGVDVAPVALVEAERVFGRQRGHAVQLPRQALELRVVGEPDARRKRRLAARPALAAAWLARVDELELEADGRRRADVRAHRHRRLAALDALEGDARHPRRLGGVDGADLQRLAPLADALAQGGELGGDAGGDEGSTGRHMYLILFRTHVFVNNEVHIGR